MKKTLYFILTFVLVISTFGCSESERKNETLNAAVDIAEETTVNKSSWETDTSPHTITWFVADDSYHKVFNPNTNTSDRKILNKTGITLDITSGDLEKLNALIAADSLPDLVTMDVSASQRTLLEKSGKILPLDSLFAQYAPDVNIPQSMKDWYRNEDGNWYTIASYYYGPERVNDEFGGYLVTHNNNFVRKDLLQEIGMTITDIRTKKGFLEALRKAKYLTYDGKKIIPYTGWWTKYFAEQFGMDREDEDGNFLTMIRQPEWLEALKFGNTLYREGLISDEEFTQNSTQREQRIASGTVFAATSTSVVQSAKEELYSYDKNALMVYAGQIQGSDSKKTPLLEGVTTGGWTGTLISANADRPDRIAEFISYMTQEEATLDAAPTIGADTYGIVDGKLMRKESVIKEFQKDYQAASSKYLLNLEFFVDWTIVQKYMSEEPQTIWEEQTLKMEKDERVHVYDSKAFLAVEPEGGSQLAAIKEDIDTYYDEAEKDILMADTEEECEKLYYEAIAEMENLGLKQLEEYENQSFQKAKEKLGIKYAWPRNTGEVN